MNQNHASSASSSKIKSSKHRSRSQRGSRSNKKESNETQKENNHLLSGIDTQKRVNLLMRGEDLSNDSLELIKFLPTDINVRFHHSYGKSNCERYLILDFDNEELALNCIKQCDGQTVGSPEKPISIHADLALNRKPRSKTSRNALNASLDADKEFLAFLESEKVEQVRVEEDIASSEIPALVPALLKFMVAQGNKKGKKSSNKKSANKHRQIFSAAAARAGTAQKPEPKKKSRKPKNKGAATKGQVAG